MGHQCYGKCLLGDCEGDDCHCSGALSGFDGPDSNALCADRALCQLLCDATDGCTSYDMAKASSRCFLNSDACGGHEESLMTDDAGYDLYVKPSDETGARRLLPDVDPGFSHTNVLRYQDVGFGSGGSFKVCFCDSKFPSRCDSAADYGVEIGPLQVSGISCLLSDKYNRKDCASMPDGGLRCYESGTMPIIDHPTYPAVADQGVGDNDDQGHQGTTLCGLHEENCP